MNGITRHFWGWDAPVPEKAAAFLTRERESSQGAPDFAGTLLIVPTAEAGRRLREALARALEQTGVLAPPVWTAEQALLPPQARNSCATPMQSQLAWQRALQNLRPEKLPALFPRPPEDCGWAWQVEMARLMMELQALTGAGGLSFADVEKHASGDAARWRDLASLAALHSAELKRHGMEDAQEVKLRTARQPVLPEGVERVVILAAPDLPPLFDLWARSCAASGVRVGVAVHAPAEMARGFDALGRPLAECWGEDAPVVTPLDDDALLLCHDAAAQAERVIAELRALAPAGRVAVGVADAETCGVLVEKLTLEEVRVFEPGGIPPRQTGLWHLLSDWRALMEGGSWRCFTRLLRVPEMRAALAGSWARGCDVLARADAFTAEHLPVTLGHALEWAGQKAKGVEAAGSDKTENDVEKLFCTTLRAAAALIDEMRALRLSEAARFFLLRVYGEREFSPENPEDHRLAAPADAWLACCAEIEDETERFGLKPRMEEALALSLEALARAPLSEPRGEVDLVLQGWLELLWESAPNLIVAGMNEEHVPGILLAHPFLPDGLRQKLGLPCQDTRFARDAYILHVLAEPRARQKGLRLLCGQWSERGDALRPSRLLFLCADAALPARVGRLFPKHQEQGAPAEPARTLAWRLRPRQAAARLETISPSRLASYLDCPFRHYLTSVLGMAGPDPDQREMSALDFGNLAHHALQQLHAHEAMRRSTDEEALADFLVEAAMRQAALQYGRRPAPLVSLQLEGLKQRLRHAAKTEAAEREAGWRILHAEWSPAKPVLIEGAKLRIHIDRVDRHEATGRIRVLDYKTSDKAGDPLGSHAPKAGRKTAEQDEWRCFDAPDGQRRLWSGLQLPLYAHALRGHGLEPLEAGYFALPKSVQDTRLHLWEDFGPAWIDSALECAAEVVRRMRAGVFWPPAAKAREAGLDDLFLGDITGTVDPGFHA